MCCSAAWAMTSIARARCSSGRWPRDSSGGNRAGGSMSIADVAEAVDEQRRQVVELARELAQVEIAPHAAEWDASHTSQEHLDEKLAELGFFGMLIPEEYGGLGLDLLTYLLVIEEIAAASAAVSV